MKRLIVLLAIVGLLFTAGCSDEFLAHDSVFKTNDHLAYSWWGYDNCDEEAEYQALQAKQGGWWGDTTSCIEIPAE